MCAYIPERLVLGVQWIRLSFALFEEGGIMGALRGSVSTAVVAIGMYTTVLKTCIPTLEMHLGYPWCSLSCDTGAYGWGMIWRGIAGLLSLSVDLAMISENIQRERERTYAFQEFSCLEYHLYEARRVVCLFAMQVVCEVGSYHPGIRFAPMRPHPDYVRIVD